MLFIFKFVRGFMTDIATMVLHETFCRAYTVNEMTDWDNYNTIQYNAVYL